jgi:hypothetical protein
MAFAQHLGGFLAGHGRGGWRIVASRFTWELPQTLLGLGAGTVALLVFNVDAVGHRDAVVVIKGWRKQRGWGGICFGSVIIGDERIAPSLNNRLYMHEFGHVLQSRASGPIYLFKYGIPSVLSARGRGIHGHHPVERDANARACIYFSQQAGFTTWPIDYNPLPMPGKRLPLHWWEFLPPIFPLRQLWIALRDRHGRPQS